MVWSKISPSDGKPRFIKRYGKMIVLTRDKSGALDSVPEGWEVVTLPNKHLKLMKK